MFALNLKVLTTPLLIKYKTQITKITQVLRGAAGPYLNRTIPRGRICLRECNHLLDSTIGMIVIRQL